MALAADESAGMRENQNAAPFDPELALFDDEWRETSTYWTFLATPPGTSGTVNRSKAPSRGSDSC